MALKGTNERFAFRLAASRYRSSASRSMELLLAVSLLAIPVHARSEDLPTSTSLVPHTIGNNLRQDGDSIAPGIPIEKELKGGETHSFRIHIDAGQFLYALVDQRGIDVVVTLVGPNAQPLLKIDSPNSNHGPEPLLAIADTSGDYRIEVAAPNKNAPAGRYEIKVVALRQATAKDKEQVNADRTFWEANKLRLQRNAAASRNGIQVYQRALSLFESGGDTYRQALTLEMIAVLHAGLGEFNEALKYYEQALPLFRSAGDKYQESSTFNGIGGAYDVLGNPTKALEYYRQALSLLPQGAEPITQGAILSNIGKIYNDLSDWQQALEYYQQALSSFRTVGEKRREAITLNNIGVAYANLGELDTSLDYSQKALSLQRSIGDKVNESKTLTSIGQVYALSGENAKALEFYLQALPLRRATGDRLGEATTLNYVGMAYASLNDPVKGLDYSQQALELATTIGDVRTRARTLGNLGSLQLSSAQPQQAAAYYNESLALFRRIGDRQNEANALYGLARVNRSEGNLGQAFQLTEQALSLFEDVRVNAGADQLRASYLASKHDAYLFCIDLLMEMNRREPGKDYAARALQTSERARARSLLDLLAEAHADIRRGLDPDLLKRERELKQELNAKAQRQLALFGQPDNQERLAQLNQSLNALEAEYQQVQAVLRKKSPAYAALTQPQPIGLEGIQQQLDHGTMLLEYALGAERSYLWAVTASSFQAYDLPGQDQIEKSARLIHDLLAARGQNKNGENAQQKLARIAQTDSELLAATSALSQMVLAPLTAQMRADRLIIVADGALQYVPFAALPVPEQLQKRESSDAHPAGKMNAIRDRATTSSYRPLIQDFEIVSLPSASVLSMQRQTIISRKRPPNTLAVIADPVFSAADERLRAGTKSMPVSQTSDDGPQNTRIIEHTAAGPSLNIRRLRFTRLEADQILAEAPTGKNLKAIDFKANRAIATSGQLGNYRYVHFATHGYIDSERPDLSAIVLSLVDEAGKPQDGFLRAHEIYNLDLPADLVVLSACETGLGKAIKGEGLVGLTRGFMYAGARRVVVSLWNVNDKATADLMARFYRGMLKENKTPPRALRAAQLEMLSQTQWQSPYYWASFVLQGEWK